MSKDKYGLDNSKSFNYSDLSIIFDVPVSTIFRHLQKGLIPSEKINGKYVIEDKTVTDILHEYNYQRYINKAKTSQKKALEDVKQNVDNIV